MLEWIKELDQLLRGSKTQTELLAEGTGHLRLKPMVGAAVALGVIYGLFMGLYAVLTPDHPGGLEQMLATALKTPALFFLTLVVTFPSLYVFSALLGVRLGPTDTLRLIVSAITVNLAVLASFGPITGFFTLSTSSYYFMKLLNVLFFTIAGAIGLGFLLNVLRRLESVQEEAERGEEASNPGGEEPPPGETTPEPEGVPPQGGAEPPVSPPKQPPPLFPWPLPSQRTTARKVFQLWVILYALVGAQMAWILRPFVGAPKLPFVWFRGREANIFSDVMRALGKLLGG